MGSSPVAPATRICRECGVEWPLTDEFFHAGGTYRWGLRPVCKVCVNRKLTAYKTQQRRLRGATEKRKPRTVDDVEEWECKTTGCGWHRRADFYESGSGDWPRSYCKRCYNQRTIEHNRKPEVRERIRERAKQNPAVYKSHVSAKTAERNERAARGVRLCRGCGCEFPFAEFHPTVDRPNGARARCRQCTNTQSVGYRNSVKKRDPIGLAEREQASRERNRESSRAADEARRRAAGVPPRVPAAPPELARERRLENQRRRRRTSESGQRERIAGRERARRLRRENPDIVREYERQRLQKRRAADPERAREKGRRDASRRNAIKRGADVRAVEARDIARLIDRQRGLCAYCGERHPLTLEHVVPLVRGGRHAIGNFVLACEWCNKSKGKRLLIEWRASGLAPGAICF